MRTDGGEKVGNLVMDANARKAMQIVELIKQYSELASTARGADHFLEGGKKLVGAWGRVSS